MYNTKIFTINIFFFNNLRLVASIAELAATLLEQAAFRNSNFDN